MIKKLLTTVTSMTMIAGIGSSLAFGTAVAHATSSEPRSRRNYAANLAPLNNSGVSGNAQLNFKGRALNVEKSNGHAKSPRNSDRSVGTGRR